LGSTKSGRDGQREFRAWPADSEKEGSQAWSLTRAAVLKSAHRARGKLNRRWSGKVTLRRNLRPRGGTTLNHWGNVCLAKCITIRGRALTKKKGGPGEVKAQWGGGESTILESLGDERGSGTYYASETGNPKEGRNTPIKNGATGRILLQRKICERKNKNLGKAIETKVGEDFDKLKKKRERREGVSPIERTQRKVSQRDSTLEQKEKQKKEKSHHNHRACEEKTSEEEEKTCRKGVTRDA